jgi:FMN phosphatase YigB (HAD superfamily)
MKVYHGSYMEIGEIDLSKCESHRDFGKGFYVTGIREQAEYWARRKGKKNAKEGAVTEYTFYENAFNNYHLHVLRFAGYSEDWLDFVVMNRNPENPEPAHDYDIVEGPVADDDIAKRIFIYIEGGISKENFIEELRFKHKPSHQIAFCTLKSLQMLKRINKRAELDMINIDESIPKALATDYDLSQEKAIDMYFTSAIYRQIIDESTALYQKPCAEIYELLLQELNLKKHPQ